MKLQESLRRAQTLGLDRIDAQLLHLFALGRELHDRAWLLAHDTDELDAATLARLEVLLQRRAAGEPLAYITGTKEFFGLPLQVDDRVLDPRPDTETLVEWALEHMPLQTPCEVIDLGTGSGDRSDRIRTYNFPQGRLTDHRINLTLYKLPFIMEGELQDVIAALQAERQAEQLAELEVGGSA